MKNKDPIPKNRIPKAFDRYLIKDPYSGTAEDNEIISYFQSEQSLLEFKELLQNSNFEAISTYLTHLKNCCSKFIISSDEAVPLISHLFPYFIQLNQKQTPDRTLIILNQTLQEIALKSIYYTRQILGTTMLPAIINLIQENANDDLRSICLSLFTCMFQYSDDTIQNIILSVISPDFQFQILSSVDAGVKTRRSIMILIEDIVLSQKNSDANADQYILKIFECINQPQSDFFLITSFLSTLGIHLLGHPSNVLQMFPKELFSYLYDHLLIIIDKTPVTDLVNIIYVLLQAITQHIIKIDLPIDELYTRLLQEAIENEKKEYIGNLIYNWTEFNEEKSDLLLNDKTIPVLITVYENGSIQLKGYLLLILGKIALSHNMQLIHALFETSVIENFIQFIVDIDAPHTLLVGYGVIGSFLQAFEMIEPYCEDHLKFLTLLNEFDFLKQNFEKELDGNIASIRDALSQKIQLHFSSFPGHNS